MKGEIHVKPSKEKTILKSELGQGLPWWSRGRTELSLPRAPVQSLVRELRSRKLCIEAKIHT